MDWMAVLKNKLEQCQQHPMWTPYWECMTRLEATKQAFADNVDDCMSEKAWREYEPLAEKVIRDQQHKLLEDLAASGADWQPPEEVDFEGDKLPTKLVLLIPYIKGQRNDQEKMARSVVLLIDANNRLTAANREVLRRALFDMCDIELVDERPLPPDVELFRKLQQHQTEYRRELRKHFEEQPDEPHVPKSQRRDFAQTRGPRPQHNAHFSKQNARGRSAQMHRGRGRGR